MTFNKPICIIYSESIVVFRPTELECFTEIQKVIHLLKVGFSGAAGILITFNDKGGDQFLPFSSG
jgi:hypothetical protein